MNASVQKSAVFFLALIVNLIPTLVQAAEPVIEIPGPILKDPCAGADFVFELTFCTTENIFTSPDSDYNESTRTCVATRDSLVGTLITNYKRYTTPTDDISVFLEHQLHLPGVLTAWGSASNTVQNPPGAKGLVNRILLASFQPFNKQFVYKYSDFHPNDEICFFEVEE